MQQTQVRKLTYTRRKNSGVFILFCFTISETLDLRKMHFGNKIFFIFLHGICPKYFSLPKYLMGCVQVTLGMRAEARVCSHVRICHCFTISDTTELRRQRLVKYPTMTFHANPFNRSTGGPCVHTTIRKRTEGI